MPHRIAYDHQIFCEQQFGGISRYVCELARMVDRMPAFEARIVAPVHFNDYLRTSDAPNVGWYHDSRLPKSIYRTVNKVVGHALTAAWRPSLVHQSLYRPAVAPRGAPVVVTVHDMIHELYPSDFPASDPEPRFKRASVARADKVICISQSTAADLMRLLDVPASKIRVIHHGAPDLGSQFPAKARGNRSRPYLLYIGHRNKYKNFANALKAYAASRVTTELDFVAFGGGGFTLEEQDLINSLLVRPGSVVQISGSDADLAEMYRHAHAFVYPSRYEGFGIPPLEAMSCGCPVLCSNTSSLPEVVADAALQFDPESIEQIKAAFETICDNATIRRTLIAAGRRRAAELTWQRCAEATAAVYAEVIGA